MSKLKIDDFKIKRNAGEMTSDIAKRCRADIARRLNFAKKNWSGKVFFDGPFNKNLKTLEKDVKIAKADLEVLPLFCQVAELSCEARQQNALIHAGKLHLSDVLHSRETILALTKKLEALLKKKSISKYLFMLCYAYRH